MIGFFTDPLSYGFMQRAMLEASIAGAICGIVGTFVVLRGLAFIADALSHAVFPGVVLSYLANQNVVIGAFVFGFFTALGVGIVSRSRRVTEDSAIGVLFVAFFALGVVLISRQTGFQRDLSSLLFGNVLGVSHDDVLITVAVGAGVLVVLLALIKEFTLAAFDSTLARSLGYPVFWLDLGLLMLVTATIVVSLQTVGNILILALIVTPPASARLLTDDLRTMMILSAALGVLSSVAGLYISYHWNLAAGATIVLVATVVFLVALLGAPDHGLLAHQIQKRRGRHHVHHYHPIEEELAE